MNTICLMREIYLALAAFEREFDRVHGLCLNEATVLCSLCGGELSASEVSVRTGMTGSHTSKVLRSVEEKGLVARVLGDKDRRQMYFSLTEKGKERLAGIRCGSVEIPEVLKPVFKEKCDE